MQYDDASFWTLSKVKGAVDKMERATPCDTWDVRALLNHMLDTQRYFTGAARGESVSPPSPTPPSLIGDNPVPTFEAGRDEMIDAFRQPGAIAKTGPILGIALAEQLIHGWDLAKATGQDTTMPEGLPEAAYEMIHGRFTDDERIGVFKPEVAISANALPQARLLAYTGRNPSQ
jgi:uncharacterized protein (TIGR03086 family)